MPTKEPIQQPLAPNTTEQEDKVTEGQRAINLLWERTQSRIAYISIMSSQLVNIAIILILLYKEKETPPATIAVITASIAAMNLTVGIIIGFYFSRTNHTAIGGVGKKDVQSKVGMR